MRLLLARDDVNPDKPDNDGQTPLWVASFYGHSGVVRLLLPRDDVNADKPDNDGETPLRWASSNGHEGVVRLLLSRHCQSRQTRQRWCNTTLGGFFL